MIKKTRVRRLPFLLSGIDESANTCNHEKPGIRKNAEKPEKYGLKRKGIVGIGKSEMDCD